MRAFHEKRGYTHSLEMWIATYEDISFIAHWHSEVEMIFVHCGETKICIEDETFVAKKGDIIICEPGKIHYSYSTHEKNKLSFILFNPQLVDFILDGTEIKSPLLTNDFLMRTNIQENICDLLSLLDKEIKSQQTYYEEICTAALRKFWFNLNRFIERKRTVNSDKKTLIYNFQKILLFLEKNFQHNITLEDISKKMNFSYNYTSKMFKDLCGMNFNSYINYLRIRYSLKQILETNHTLLYIALDSGFTNLRTFNRVFKLFTGTTPSDYKKNKISTQNIIKLNDVIKSYDKKQVIDSSATVNKK